MPLYFAKFGKPLYPLDQVSFLRINVSPEIHIEGRLGTFQLKIVFPKKYEKLELNKIKELIELENMLCEWMSDKLDVEIER